ncbi:MAG: sulfite reductase subunit alpha [Opitutus sp.]
MISVPTIPDSAPFTAEQRAWLNGYFAGLFSRGQLDPVAATAAPGPTAAALAPLTILFGSQTGTAETLAKRAAKDAGKRGFVATIMDMAAFTAAQLAQEQNVLIITSTYGDGEPPDNAKALHWSLMAAANPMFTQLHFSVCGLGDTNYAKFNQCAKDFDAQLVKLGGVRVAPCVECDLEYEEKFSSWLGSALGAFGPPAAQGGAVSIPAAAVASVAEPEPVSAPGFSRQNPFPAIVLASRNLNAPGSAKQVHHVEFDLSGSNLAYEAGDALGVFAHNCPELVQDVLTALGCDGEEAVNAPDGSTTSLRRALTELYDLGKPSPELLVAGRNAAAMSGPLKSIDGAGVGLAAAVPHHVIDVLLSPDAVRLTPVDFVKLLRRLQPRLYSISSSPAAHAGQVHLTVGAVRYEKNGRGRKGVCSTFLADRTQAGATRVGVYIHSNKAFRPPASGDTPMIMVGPGTGIAPFRGFLHERRAAGAKGRNWLLFGDQRAATDFLYRDELADLMRGAVLTRLDTAFSRDQAEKIYVQHRMLENAAELYAWLQVGAHFYVCGDANRMAKDVDVALHQVIETAGGATAEQAAAYVQNLKATKRYARDVY